MTGMVPDDRGAMDIVLALTPMLRDGLAIMEFLFCILTCPLKRRNNIFVRRLSEGLYRIDTIINL